jgi:hypothetical protein
MLQQHECCLEQDCCWLLCAQCLLGGMVAALRTDAGGHRVQRLSLRWLPGKGCSAAFMAAAARMPL